MVKSKKRPSSIPDRPNPRANDHSCHQQVKQILSKLENNNDQVKIIQGVLENIRSPLNYLKKPLVSSQICSICAFNFDSLDRIPICLPCGHTICKHCVYSSQHSSPSGICPYDRREYFFIKELLPTNYSILNTENLEESQTCTTHGLELVAFCIDHDSLLCGKCIFSHISHNFFEISSERAKSMVEEKFKALALTEERLKELILIWEDYIESLKQNLDSIEDRPELKKVAKKIRKSLCTVSEVSVIGLVEKSKKALDVVISIKGIFRDFNIYQKLSVNSSFPETNRPSYIDINF